MHMTGKTMVLCSKHFSCPHVTTQGKGVIGCQWHPHNGRWLQNPEAGPGRETKRVWCRCDFPFMSHDFVCRRPLWHAADALIVG